MNGQMSGPMVTWLPKFLGWMDNQIFLAMRLCSIMFTKEKWKKCVKAWQSIACATNEPKLLVFVHLWNNAKTLVLGPHLCTRIWVCAMIGLLKMPLLTNQPNWREIWDEFEQLLSLMGSQKKDIGTASQTLLLLTSLDYVCDEARQTNWKLRLLLSPLKD